MPYIYVYIISDTLVPSGSVRTTLILGLLQQKREL